MKPGDKVRVRTGMEVLRFYGKVRLERGMKCYEGEEFVIAGRVNQEAFGLDGPAYAFSEQMLELIERDPNFRPVRFYCGFCGRETQIKTKHSTTVGEMAEELTRIGCSACMMKRVEEFQKEESR